MAFSALFGVVALNALLGYATQHLADMMHLRLQHYGATVPALTVLVLAFPPGFHVVAVVTLLVLGLGIWRVLTDGKMICAALGFLILDSAVLLMMLWGVTHVAVRMR